MVVLQAGRTADCVMMVLNGQPLVIGCFFPSIGECSLLVVAAAAVEGRAEYRTALLLLETLHHR